MPRVVQPLVIIRFHNGGPTLRFPVRRSDELRNTQFRFVAEEANPENHLGVERADLLYPADILRGGMSIIDNPGIGSTSQHNTEAAMQVRCRNFCHWAIVRGLDDLFRKATAWFKKRLEGRFKSKSERNRGSAGTAPSSILRCSEGIRPDYIATGSLAKSYEQL